MKAALRILPLSILLCVGADGMVMAQPAPNGSQKSFTPSISEVKVPGNPFIAVPSMDGQWVFATLTGTGSRGLAVLHREGAGWLRSRVVPFKQGMLGLALTHDGKTLLATAGNYIVGFDVQKVLSGDANPSIGSFLDPDTAPIEVAITPDDRYAFVSNERSASVSVIDLAQARRDGLSATDLIGKIPVGQAPVGLAFSTDGRLLYVTSEVAPADYGWPKVFSPPANPGAEPTSPEGVLSVIDVRLAETDPAHAATQRARAGNSPVRVVLSPRGDCVYVTVRGANEVDVFGTADMALAPERGALARIPVGSAPVGLAVSNDGSRLFVANSDRFSQSNKPSSLAVIDTAKLTHGAAAVIGSIPAGVFPREIHLTADGKTLIVTNFLSETIEFVDISGFLPPENGER